MNARATWVRCSIAWALIAGCGTIDNSPLRQGVVRGQVEGASPGLGLVTVFGQPGLRDAPGEDGTFEISGVPAGPVELLVLASATAAARVPVEVLGGQVVDVGLVVPGAPAFANFDVEVPAHLTLHDGRLTVEGTPYEGLHLDPRGHHRVGPLPAGSYGAQVTVVGLGGQSVQFELLAGQTREVPVSFPGPDGTPGHEGCLLTGCAGTDRCTGDGRCVECLEQRDCAQGLTCRNERCEGELGGCSPCQENYQCGAGRCESHSGSGDKVCVDLCDELTPCAKPGFQCFGERCVPMLAELQGCYAYRQVGGPCTGDESCRQAGILNGVCSLGSCTYACASPADCPEGFECQDEGLGGECRR